MSNLSVATGRPPPPLEFSQMSRRPGLKEPSLEIAAKCLMICVSKFLSRKTHKFTVAVFAWEHFIHTYVKRNMSKVEMDLDLDLDLDLVLEYYLMWGGLQP